MSKKQKYFLIALVIVLLLGAITQSITAVTAALIGAVWAKLKIIYWNRALNKMKKPPSGGIKNLKFSYNPNTSNMGLAF